MKNDKDHIRRIKPDVSVQNVSPHICENSFNLKFHHCHYWIVIFFPLLHEMQICPSSTKPCNYANVHRGQLLHTNNEQSLVDCVLFICVTKALLLWHFIRDNFHTRKYWKPHFVQLWNGQPFEFWRYILKHRTTG